MMKTIDIYDHDRIIGQMEVVPTEDAPLVAAYACLDEKECPLFVMVVDGLDYGTVISERVFYNIQEAQNEEKK